MNKHAFLGTELLVTYVVCKFWMENVPDKTKQIFLQHTYPKMKTGFDGMIQFYMNEHEKVYQSQEALRKQGIIDDKTWDKTYEKIDKINQKMIDFIKLNLY